MALTVRDSAEIRSTIVYAVNHSDPAEEQAALIKAELRHTMSNALAAVVGRRVVAATTGAPTVVALLVVPLAIIGGLLGANVLAAARRRRRAARPAVTPRPVPFGRTGRATGSHR